MNKKSIIIIVIAVLALIIGLFIGVNISIKPLVIEEKPLIIEKPSPLEISSLAQKLGDDNPLRVIKEDLMAKSDLIPYEGVLGGTMGFYDDEGITILSDKWVIATFEDGHNMGRMILRFDIDNSRSINWKVIDHHLK